MHTPYWYYVYAPQHQPHMVISMLTFLTDLQRTAAVHPHQLDIQQVPQGIKIKCLHYQCNTEVKPARLKLVYMSDELIEK